MKKLLLAIVLILMPFLLVSQTFTQLTSEDLELPFSETIVKHGSDWYIGTSGGVFKSSDNGSTWNLVNTDLYATLGELRVEGFLSNGTKLFGLNRWGGIAYTIDGTQWLSSVNGLPNDIELTSLPVVIGSRMLIGISDRNVGEVAIYYSENNGESWNKGAVFDNWIELKQAGDTAMIIVDNTIPKKTIDGINIDTTTFTDGYEGGKIESIYTVKDSFVVFTENEIYRYNLEKRTWTNIGEKISGGIGFVSGIVSDNGTIYITVFGESNLSLFSSTDIGDTWVDKTPTLSMGMPFSIGGYAAGDELMCCFVDGGIYYSSNAGASFQEANKGALASNFEEITNVNDVLVTSLLISGAYVSSDQGSVWHVSSTGLGDDMIKHLSGFESIGSKLFANYSSNPDDNAAPNRVYVSSDNGDNWNLLDYPIDRTNLGILGTNGTTLFLCSYSDTDSAYYRMDSGTSTYTDISANLPTNVAPISILGDGQLTFLFGVNPASRLEIYTSSDIGDSWGLALDGINVSELDSLTRGDMNEFQFVCKEGKTFVEINYNNWNHLLFRWSENIWVEASLNGLNNLDLGFLDFHDGKLFAANWNRNLMLSYDDGDSFIEYGNLPDGLGVKDATFIGNEIYLLTDRGLWKGDLPVSVEGNETTFNQYRIDKFDKLIFDKAVEGIRMYSMDGKIIFESAVKSKKYNLSSLLDAMYILEFNYNGKMLREKILK